MSGTGKSVKRFVEVSRICLPVDQPGKGCDWERYNKPATPLAEDDDDLRQGEPDERVL